MKTNFPTRIALFVGLGMIASTLFAPFFSLVDAFSIVGLVWGSLLITAAIYLHHLAEHREVEKQIRLRRLETIAAGMELRKELLSSVLKNGLPEGLSREWVERILNGNNLGRDFSDEPSR